MKQNLSQERTLLQYADDALWKSFKACIGGKSDIAKSFLRHLEQSWGALSSVRMKGLLVAAIARQRALVDLQ